jgi:hypothetical protein
METRKLDNDSKSVSKRFLLKLLIPAGIAFVLLFPYQTTVVPEWKIRVVDENGQPFAGARVRQQWHHYSYDLNDGDDRTADGNGYVVFPERTFTAPLLYRALRSGLAYVLTLAHGSTGIRASVWALSQTRSSDFIDYKPGMPLVQEIVLRR